MACTFSLDPLEPVVVNGKLQSLKVSGTVSITPPDACGDLNVRVRCPGNDVSVGAQVSIIQDAFSHVFTQVEGLTPCCGSTVSIFVGCGPTCQQTFDVPLNCGTTTCPAFGHLLTSVGPCKFDGTVDVSCSVPLISLGTYPQVTVQWTVNDVAFGAPVVVTAPGTISTVLTLPGSGQPAAIALQYLDPPPPACPPLMTQIVLPSCVACPPIELSHAIGECNQDGRRNVTVTAILSAGTNTPISAQMTGPFPAVTGTGTGSLTLTATAQLNSGSYTVTVSAGSCPPQSYTFPVTDCCPTVAFRHSVRGWPICTGDETREVMFAAVVTPQPGVQTTASLIDDQGVVLATGTSSSEFTLKGTDDYAGGTHSVHVVFGAPLQCPPQAYFFCVPKCETLKCFNLRSEGIVVSLAIFIFIGVQNGIAGLAGYLDTYATSGNYWYLFGRCHDYNVGMPSALGSLQALALTAAIGFFAWWALCIIFPAFQLGACCSTWCTLRLILWQVPLIVGLALFYFLACSWLLNSLTAIVLLFFSWLFRRSWRRRCCPGECDPLFYMAISFISMGVLVAAPIEAIGISGACISKNGGTSGYPEWYREALLIATIVVRILIGYWTVNYPVRYVMCLLKKF